MTLSEVLKDEAKKNSLTDDCVTMIDEEVSDKSGISGIAIKASFAAVKGIKPGFIRHVVSDLLPEFAKALEPIYAEAKASSQSIPEFFVANSSRVAEALLAITDAKSVKSTGLVKSTYDKLRPKGKAYVEAAVPRLSRLIEKFER